MTKWATPDKQTIESDCPHCGMMAMYDLPDTGFAPHDIYCSIQSAVSEYSNNSFEIAGHVFEYLCENGMLNVQSDKRKENLK